ncbi:citrate transporter [Haloarcula laminariae]|uniref:citrate transporter n=1 Tax=Haloarcula laminariae TaxID=2961577 RepID=UPI0021C9E0C0|nr:citrate transporter [Halomicroarcula laminariae]
MVELAAVGIIVAFIIFGSMMMFEVVPTFIALGGMAIAIGFAGGLGPQTILQDIVAGGSTRLASAMIAAAFGGTLGVLAEKQGILEDIVKSAAELGGDSPLVMAAALYTAVVIASTSISGLGAFILMATIVFPILVSVGFTQKIAGAITLLAYGNGVMLNPSNWVFYQEVTGIALDSVINWALPVAGLAYVVGIIYVFLKVRNTEIQATLAETDTSGMSTSVPKYALIAPVIPVGLVVFDIMNVYAAFIVGIVYAAVFSQPGLEGIKNLGGTLNLITQSFHDGIKQVAPAIALMVAIGWLLKAVFADPISSTMEPLLMQIIPESMVLYAIMFSVLAPLALYRGPMNIWGLGSGIIGVLAAIGINPQLITTTAISALRVQAPGDPTNTHNAWAAEELEVSVNSITKEILPFIWVIAAGGVVTSVYLFGL